MSSPLLAPLRGSLECRASHSTSFRWWQGALAPSGLTTKAGTVPPHLSCLAQDVGNVWPFRREEQGKRRRRLTPLPPLPRNDISGEEESGGGPHRSAILCWTGVATCPTVSSSDAIRSRPYRQPKSRWHCGMMRTS